MALDVGNMLFELTDIVNCTIPLEWKSQYIHGMYFQCLKTGRGDVVATISHIAYCGSEPPACINWTISLKNWNGFTHMDQEGDVLTGGDMKKFNSEIPRLKKMLEDKIKEIADTRSVGFIIGKEELKERLQEVMEKIG